MNLRRYGGLAVNWARILSVIAIVALVSPLASAQGPTPGHPVSVEELARQLQQTQYQLQQTRIQLQQLEQRDRERTAWQEQMIERLPPVDAIHQPVSFGRMLEETSDEACCPKCGKDICPGLPHLCGLCLDKLSWNKKGGWRIVPFGRLRGEFIYSSAPYTNNAVIVFLNPRQAGIGEDTTVIHAKQSQLNFAITGPNCGNWQTGGLILMNFMGPQPLRNISGVNVVNAYGEIKNDRWRYAFGRMLDLFGPISPTTVNQISQRGAGDVGIYRGAFHIDRYFTLSDCHKWTLSARLSQQDFTDYQIIPQVRGTDNGWPNVEARMGVELGALRDGVRPLTVGVSGLIGETQGVADELLAGGVILPAIDDVSVTWGVCLDAQLQGKVFGARGEVWMGQAAGTYFMATLQSINIDAQGDGIPNPIRSYGGWGELYAKPWDRWAFHVGFGIDDPNNNDTGFVTVDNTVGQIRLNQVAWANAIWNVTDYFELAFEISHRETHYINPNNANDGMLYQFASSLKF